MYHRPPFALALLALPAIAYAQQAPRMAPDDAESDLHFGIEVAAGSDYVVVGTGPNGSVVRPRAYVYRREGGGWLEQAELRPEPSASFGSRLTASGECALFGMPRDNTGGFHSGSAYVFCRRDGAWVEEEWLRPGDPREDAAFGTAVALGPDLAVIGASGDAEGGFAAGAVYVFRRDSAGWHQEVKLTGVAEYDGLGFRVYLSGNLLAAWDRDAILLFRYDGAAWIEEAVINEGLGGWYGPGALAGDTLVVGDPGYIDPDYPDEPGGAAYVYTRTAGAWERTALVRPPPPGAPSTACAFGAAVSLSSAVLAVGEPCYSEGEGRVHVYRPGPDGWEHEGYRASDAPGGHYGSSLYGSAVSVSASFLIVGAPEENSPVPAGGAAYGYDLGVVLAGPSRPPVAHAPGVTLAPNPAAGAILVTHTLTRTLGLRVRVLDVVGRVVLSGWPPSGADRAPIRLDVSALPAGVYVCLVEGTGEAVQTTFAVVR